MLVSRYSLMMATVMAETYWEVLQFSLVTIFLELQMIILYSIACPILCKNDDDDDMATFFNEKENLKC